MFLEIFTKSPKKQELRAAERKNRWRQKHEEFIQSVRAAKGVDDYDTGGGYGESYNNGYDTRTYSKPRQQQQQSSYGQPKPRLPPQQYQQQYQPQQQQRAVKPGYTHVNRTYSNGKYIHYL